MGETKRWCQGAWIVIVGLPEARHTPSEELSAIQGVAVDDGVAILTGVSNVW